MIFVLMALPTVLQFAGIVYLFLHFKNLNSGVWKVGRNILIASVIAKVIYVVAISIQLQFEWQRVALVILMAVIAYSWHRIYLTRRKTEIAQAEQKALNAERNAKRLAKDLDFPWPDQLTHERETARLMSEVEDAWKKEKN